MSAIFSEPVRLNLDGSIRTVSSLYGAEQMMVDIAWPIHGHCYEEALAAIVLAIDGKRSTADAERAFRAAAVEAGLLRG
jgi:hypothetical protein